MGTLQPNGIWKPGTTEPGELHVLANTIAASASNAIGGLGEHKRQPRKFRVSSRAELVTIESFAQVGDKAYVHADAWWETLTDNGWRVTRTTRAVPFTPNFDWRTNITIDPGHASNLRAMYSINEEVVTVSASVHAILGTAERTEFPLPIPAEYGGTNVGVLGTVIYQENQVREYPGNIVGYEGSGGRLAAQLTANSSSAPGGLWQFVQRGIPYTSTYNGLMLSVNFSYIRA